MVGGGTSTNADSNGEGKPLLSSFLLGAAGGGGGAGAALSGTRPPASPKLYGSQSPHLRGRLGSVGSGKMRRVNSATGMSDVSSAADSDEDGDGEHHKTDNFETFIHLLKGYIGPGCLSLPWAVSQLGLLWGMSSICVLGIWSSYNCWTVVRLKRHIEHVQARAAAAATGKANTNDLASETGAASSVAMSQSSVATSITYPDVGEWAYGSQFQSYVQLCVCTQQLAICTVFISFIGENLLALFHYMGITFMATHIGVMTLAMPFILGLSFLPSLKSLAPVMAAGTVLLMATFVAIGVAIEMEWHDRPTSTPQVIPSMTPLAMCAILYSYEGINLILPVESAMKQPKHFGKIFVLSMACVSAILAGLSAICVIAFGYVTNGSVTAFLLDEYRNDPLITFWIMVANTAVSLSVLLTYPLQLFPALELLGPSVLKMKCWVFGGKDLKDDDGDDVADDDLSAFEPLPPISEHGYTAVEPLPPMEHNYDADEDFRIDGDQEDKKDGGGVDSDDEEEAIANSSVAKSAISSMAVSMMMPKLKMPGDSLTLRSGLVLMTYLVAVAIPNVQSLISLAGALAGSSTALLIPPVLELAWIRQMEGHHLHHHPPASVAGAGADGSGGQAGEGKSWLLQWLSSLKANVLRYKNKWLLERIKCYFLFLLGFIFMGIGTYSSLMDIIRIYASGGGDGSE